MDFGTRPGATAGEIDLNRAEHMTSEYVINGLVQRQCFQIMEKDLVWSKLQEDGIRCEGLIDPDSAKRIGELLHVRYIVYGNVVSVSTSESGAAIAATSIVRAHVQARVMDAETGNIVMAVSGNGSSGSTRLNNPGAMKIAMPSAMTSSGAGARPISLGGSFSVSMESVHNAIAKAADDAAEKIAVKCGIPPTKKK